MLDRFMDQAMNTKHDKYSILIMANKEQGWVVKPLIVIAAKVRALCTHKV
jgi:hypothetical protein